MTELLLLIALAAVPLAFVRPLGRRIFFVLGLLFALAVAQTPLGRSGLHGEGIIFAVPGLLLCIAVILAETGVRFAAWRKRSRRDGQ